MMGIWYTSNTQNIGLVGSTPTSGTKYRKEIHMKSCSLDKKVLLLSQSMQPIDIIDGRKGIEKLFEGKAEVLEEYDDALIRSARLSLNLPCVMRLLKNTRKRRLVKFSRNNIFYRDGERCQYCGKKFPRSELTLDHIVPKCTRTPDSYKSWTNIVAACKPCNRYKAGRTPEQAGMRLLKKPTKLEWVPDLVFATIKDLPEKWLPYIEWSV